jgi:hypothetical protein
MSHNATGLVNYGLGTQQMQGAQQQAASNLPPVSSSLEGIRRRIDQIASNVHDMHGIADRACGQTAQVEKGPVPQSVPNGMLDEIENALDGLVNLSNSAVARLSRIA